MMRMEFQMMKLCLNLVATLALICAFGCASHRTKVGVKDWRVANIHKVVVVCLQEDSESNRRIESQMVPRLQHQGFDAIAPQNFFPIAAQYSPKVLMDQMRRAGVDGIMELNYSGEAIVNGGLPPGIRIKYYSIKSRDTDISNRSVTLDSALFQLTAGTTR